MSNNHTPNHDALPLGTGCLGCCKEAVERERERLREEFQEAIRVSAGHDHAEDETCEPQTCVGWWVNRIDGVLSVERVEIAADGCAVRNGEHVSAESRP
jgi:hypothetical protein